MVESLGISWKEAKSICVTLLMNYHGVLFDVFTILANINITVRFAVRLEIISWILIISRYLLLNPAFDSKEINFKGCNINLIASRSDTCGKQKYVICCSFVIKLNLYLVLYLEKSNGLPKFPITVSILFGI
jgi:hypothetical protein